jgi:hypothetical protein
MSYYYGGYPYGYGYPYGGYPYGYGYPYGGYPYSLPLLANNYKLAGLYNELDELNDVEAKYGRDFNPDVSMNHGLHTQLKEKNYELVQHIVQKDIEIDELKNILKTHNIHHNMSTSPVDIPNIDSTPRRFYPHYPYHHRPRPHHPYYPYHYPYYGYRDGTSETHSVNAPPAAHMIVPRAINPDSHDMNYIIPPHVHLRTLPCVLPPPLTPMPPPEPVPVPM